MRSISARKSTGYAAHEWSCPPSHGDGRQPREPRQLPSTRRTARIRASSDAGEGCIAGIHSIRTGSARQSVAAVAGRNCHVEDLAPISHWSSASGESQDSRWATRARATDEPMARGFRGAVQECLSHGAISFRQTLPVKRWAAAIAPRWMYRAPVHVPLPPSCRPACGATMDGCP